MKVFDGNALFWDDIIEGDSKYISKELFDNIDKISKSNIDMLKETYKKVIVSGSVPIENYSQLFSSFVNTLKKFYSLF